MPPVIHDVIQGTPEWHELRKGIPTASRFAMLLTPKQGKPSAQARKYLYRCLAEVMLDAPLDEESSQWMEYGRKMEKLALKRYAIVSGNDVQRVGFVTDDDKTVGCSPDGLVGDDGGVEAKAPAAQTHVEYMCEPGSLTGAYRMQIQGGLWVCERQWWDIVSYNRAMGTVIERVERDEPLIEKLAAAVAAFNEQLHAALVEHGYREPEQETESDGNAGNEGVRRVRDDEGCADLSAAVAASQ